MEAIEVFIEYLDGIYYEGYARHLAEDNPTAYNFELNQFFDNYNFTNHDTKPNRHLSEGNEPYSIAA